MRAAMKRSALSRRTPLGRGRSALSRTVALRARSAKRTVEQRARRVSVAALLAERGPWCQARLPVCAGLACDAHEVLTRARGGSITDPANILLVCRPCHDWIGSSPVAAAALGLVRWSWEGA